MKFSPEELIELTTPNGGRFCVSSVKEAFDFCTRRAQSHYENFPVASVLLPRALRPHFYSVYSFARLADDIADEPGLTTDVRLERLSAITTLLRQTEQINGNPVFTALAHTRQQYDLPIDPFERLLHAFRMDSKFLQPRTFADLEHYCHHSANPIGELVLRLHGLYSPVRQGYADALCTGLQLANFWQDLSVDRQSAYQQRITIPVNILQRHGISTDDVLQGTVEDKRLLPCLQDVYTATQVYFRKGRRLLGMIPSLRLRAELALTLAGGERILRKTATAGVSILQRRPRLRKTDVAMLAGTSLFYFCTSFFQPIVSSARAPIGRVPDSFRARVR